MLEAAATHLNSVAQVCKFSDLRDQKFRKETETKYFATNMFTVFKEMADKYCLLYTSPSPRDQRGSRMPSSA